MSLLALAIALTTVPLMNVPEIRIERLRKGANVTCWFWRYEPGRDFAKFVNDADMQRMRKLGLKHVRLAIDPRYVYDPARPETIHPTTLAALKDCTERFIRHEIAVVLDFHNMEKEEEKKPEWNEGLIPFWRSFAREFKGFNPDWVYFELMNEPVYPDQSTVWFDLQTSMVKAIREVAPNHTIIVTGAEWGGIQGLLKLPKLEDSNLVYSFHCYDPFIFTHQGATWAGPVPPHLKEIPYPVNAEIAEPKMAVQGSDEARGWLKDYGQKGFAKKELQAAIQSAIDYGKNHQVPVYMGEFGVIWNAPADSRARWFKDMGEICQETGVNWCVWGWDDGFGLHAGWDGIHSRVNPDVARALGLTP